MKDLLLIGGLLGVGYYFLNKNNKNPFNTLLMDKSYFPLKEGDNNVFVTNIQKALLNKGGEASQLILAAGGATGEFNAQTAKAIQTLGYPVNLSETHYRQLVNTTDQVRNIAYVIDVNGAELFREVGDTPIANYDFGRDLILKLPAKTHLGSASKKTRQR